MVDGGRLQSGAEKDGFVDLVCSVVNLQLRAADKTREAHWPVN